MDGGGGGEVVMLRQLIGQIQELCDLFGRATPPLPSHHPRRYVLDTDKSPMDDDYCGFIMGGKSGSLKMVEANQSPPAKKCRREKSFENSITSSSSTLTLEPQVWRDFPEDLIEAVIARLPIVTFFRFRLVCQKWNSLLTSNSFAQQCAEAKQPYPWFYTISHENINSGAMYDPSLKKWHHPSIPSLPEKAIILPMASAGGLICFLDIGHRNFYVSNPLTRSFKELPPKSAHVWSRVAVGMIRNGHALNCGYKIVWIGCDGDYEVYDSVHNCWTHPGTVPPSIRLPLSLKLRSSTVSIGSTLYFMRADPDGIVSYDVVTGGWKQFLIPSPVRLTDPMLAESGGRLMLVGLLSKNAATCVYIWELQRMTLLWKEVDRMPNEWCLEFYGRHVRMTCLGNQGLLMLSLRSRRMNRLVTYDISSRKWQQVPDCVPPCGSKRQWIACGTTFHPCLTALP